MAKKRKQAPEPFESIGKNDRFVRLHIELIESEAFKRLNGRQQSLYLYMKAQYKGKETKNNPNRNKLQFYFNWNLAEKKYRLYTNRDTFYKDIKVLIEYGFIECVENNHYLRKKSIYSFSDKWKSIQ